MASPPRISKDEQTLLAENGWRWNLYDKCYCRYMGEDDPIGVAQYQQSVERETPNGQWKLREFFNSSFHYDNETFYDTLDAALTQSEVLRKGLPVRPPPNR